MLAEVVPDAKLLSQKDKLQLIRILADELVADANLTTDEIDANEDARDLAGARRVPRRPVGRSSVAF